MKAELALAFSAGAFTFLSPCAFLVPAYLSYYVQRESSEKFSVPRGLAAGAVISIAVLLAFTAFGMLTGFAGSFFKSRIVKLQPLIGAFFVAMGVAMFFNFRLRLLRFEDVKERRGLFAFGLLYALAIIGCSAPIFLSIAAYAFGSGSALTGAKIFSAYSLGVALPFMGISLAGEGARKLALDYFAERGMLIRKIAGVSMAAVGAYMIYGYAMLYFMERGVGE